MNMIDTFTGRFSEQVAVVTGGASGIGKAVALRLAQEGAHVVIADHDQNALAMTLKELGGHGSISSLPLDITDEEQVKMELETLTQTYGQLDIMFNSAGINVSQCAANASWAGKSLSGMLPGIKALRASETASFLSSRSASCSDIAAFRRYSRRSPDTVMRLMTLVKIESRNFVLIASPLINLEFPR